MGGGIFFFPIYTRDNSNVHVSSLPGTEPSGWLKLREKLVKHSPGVFSASCSWHCPNSSSSFRSSQVFSHPVPLCRSFQAALVFSTSPLMLSLFFNTAVVHCPPDWDITMGVVSLRAKGTHSGPGASLLPVSCAQHPGPDPRPLSHT